MRYRYTLTELTKKDSEDYLDDLSLIQALINERQGDCTNAYSPLHKRLAELSKKIEILQNHGNTEIN